MDNKHQLTGPHPYFSGTIQVHERYNQSLRSPREHEHIRPLSSQTWHFESHYTYGVYSHRAQRELQSEATWNNGSEESDVTTDCPPFNNVSFNLLVSSWRWDNHSTVPGPQDRLRPPTAASVHSHGHMGGMWPSRAHADQLNECIMWHGGRAIHA